MTQKSKQSRSQCPINFAQETIGDQWSLLIIRDMIFMGKKYYGDFLKSGEKISTNILADRLEKLEANGLISKSIDENNRTKTIYTLTQKGADLLPLLIETIAWGAKYSSNKTPKEFMMRLKNDKETLIREIQCKIKIAR